MTQAILFDFDGTLVDLDKKRSYQSVINKYGRLTFHNDAAELYDFDHLQCKKGDYDRTKVFRHFQKYFKEKNVSTLCDFFWKAMEEHQIVKEHSVEILRKFRSSQIRLFCTTSTDGPFSNKRRRIIASGLSSFFEKIYIDEEIGHLKGTLENIQFIVQDADLTAQDCILIGDKISFDLLPAQKIGIKTILMKNPQYEGSWEIEITSLSELSFHIPELA